VDVATITAVGDSTGSGPAHSEVKLLWARMEEQDGDYAYLMYPSAEINMSVSARAVLTHIIIIYFGACSNATHPTVIINCINFRAFIEAIKPMPSGPHLV
jgi:hypothetical protein